MTKFWLSFVPLFLAVDAIGTLPLFVGLTEGPDRRRATHRRTRSPRDHPDPPPRERVPGHRFRHAHQHPPCGLHLLDVTLHWPRPWESGLEDRVEACRSPAGVDRRDDGAAGGRNDSRIRRPLDGKSAVKRRAHRLPPRLFTDAQGLKLVQEFRRTNGGRFPQLAPCRAHNTERERSRSLPVSRCGARTLLRKNHLAYSDRCPSL